MRMNRTTSYQTVVGADNSTGVLAYDPAQVGAGVDTGPGAITNASSDYAYATPDADYDMDLLSRRSMSARGVGRIGRNPYVYSMPEKPSLPGGGNYGNISQMTNTGAPNGTVLDLPAHGPFDEQHAVGDIPMTPLPKRITWFDRLIGRTNGPTPVKAMGRPTVDDKTTESESVLGQNVFIVPNVRQLFDTPGVAGVGTDERGQPYVAKAGRPVQDNRFMPMDVEVRNTRRDLPSESLPFLPDRVRAGAADPATQSRVAESPQWLFQRSFDQGIAQHMTGVKGVVRNATAGRPIATSSEAASDIAGRHMGWGNRGYKVSTPAPGLNPSGPMPNTMRNVPAPWDSDLYAAPEQNSGRGRGYRGR